MRRRRKEKMKDELKDLEHELKDALDKIGDDEVSN
jgi:hypothetical protein